MYQIQWLSWLVLFLSLMLIWSGCYFFLPFLPMMVFLQWGFRLLRQALESWYTPMIWPPPLPDPPFFSGVCHFLPFPMVTCFPHQIPFDPIPDSQILWKQMGCRWQHFTWCFWCFIYPSLWLLLAIDSASSSTFMTLQIPFLFVGIWILWLFLWTTFSSLGHGLDAFSNGCCHSDLVMVTDSHGKSSLRLCSPHSFQLLGTALWVHAVLGLLRIITVVVHASWVCFLFVMSWSFGFHLCGPCPVAGIFFHSCLMLPGWGVGSGWWIWMVFYFRSLPCKCSFFLCDLLLEDSLHFLQEALDDLIPGHPSVGWQLDSLSEFWLGSSLVAPCPFHVDCSSMSQ